MKLPRATNGFKFLRAEELPNEVELRRRQESIVVDIRQCHLGDLAVSNCLGNSVFLSWGYFL
jgi:hypothetical protein